MDWIKYIKTNENEALRIIYKDFRTPCVNWIVKEWNIELEEAVEIFQWSVVILYDNIMTEKLSQLNSDIKTYLWSIARNKARELIYKKQRDAKFEKSFLAIQYVYSENKDKEILEENILKANRALEKLGDPCKSLLKLFYYKQKKLNEIATLMGYKNHDSVKNQKYKCMKRLQTIYTDLIKEKKVERF